MRSKRRSKRSNRSKRSKRSKISNRSKGIKIFSKQQFIRDVHVALLVIALQIIFQEGPTDFNADFVKKCFRSFIETIFIDSSLIIILDTVIGNHKYWDYWMKSKQIYTSIFVLALFIASSTSSGKNTIKSLRTINTIKENVLTKLKEKYSYYLRKN
jgi:hypothetical protein